MPNKEPYVAKWHTYSQDQVLDRFMTLKGAFTDGEGSERFVYIPGTRKDRCLIVAHADTVWCNLDIKYDIHQGIIYSTQRLKNIEWNDGKGGKFNKLGVGLGADDRAGCAMAWRLRNLGHSILITSGEEIGCIAAKRMLRSKWWKKELNDTHTFAIELDRHGYNDIVFYDVGTNKFVDYVKSQTGYKPQKGFSTDIRHICKDICGVNISVGYVDEHLASERLVVPHWENTLMVVRSWLSQPLKRFEQSLVDRYEHVEKVVARPVTSSTTGKKVIDLMGITRVSPPANNDVGPGMVICGNCNTVMPIGAWIENVFLCHACKQEIG